MTTLLYTAMLTNNHSLRLETTQGMGCRLQRLDPFDISIRKFMDKPEPLNCSGSQLELTHISEDEWLHVNQTALKASTLKLICFYRCYDRLAGDDHELRYSEWMPIINRVKLVCEFVETRCKKTTFPGTIVYYNNHNQVLKRADAECSLATKKSVILIVLDSVSHSNFVRNMPKSLEVLKSLYKSHVFDGMSKVGDQSFPNAVAFLTGREHTADFGDTSGFFDDHPLIWKNFAQKGFVTSYAEDYPEFNLFSYLARGFRRKPVHHYLSWFTELGHDYMNMVNVADEDFKQFLTAHFSLFESSFLFVLSDHGHRFDSIRRTAVGRMEESLPFFSMHIPTELAEKYPHLVETIERNTQKTQRSKTLYLKDRNCREAGVPDEYCMCHWETAVDHNTRIIRELAHDLVVHLNNRLSSHKRCAKLSLSRVLHATIIERSDIETTPQQYRIIIEAAPSRALFEALVKYSHTAQVALVYDRVNRINSYGNQSLCVYEQELRKYCYCI
ncbi:unnamed protein product [Nippostrongylus brasiliensis]|uniref:Sulfatase domain-containing protein n=1 Tax=Nippostrongylus brasiliensis TaxID=27835 RepID=A0A0N4YG11_NIPBR|nr:unnamed protein product [Nippostrongylus brasiliensis]